MLFQCFSTFVFPFHFAKNVTLAKHANNLKNLPAAKCAKENKMLIGALVYIYVHIYVMQIYRKEHQEIADKNRKQKNKKKITRNQKCQKKVNCELELSG